MSSYVDRHEHQLAQAKNNMRLGDRYLHMGDIARAAIVYADAHTILLQIYGPNHLRGARSLHGVAKCRIRQAAAMVQTMERERLLRETHGSLKEVLRIQRLAGERCAPVDLATTYHNLGIVLSKLGAVHRNEALEFFWEALFIRVRAFTREHPLVAETLSEIVLICGRMVSIAIIVGAAAA